MVPETGKPGQESIPCVLHATSVTQAAKSISECRKQVQKQRRMRHHPKHTTMTARASARENANMQEDTRQQPVETTMRLQGNLCIRLNM